MKTHRNIQKLLKAKRKKNLERKKLVEDTMNEIQGWPDWKKRAALCNYKFGKEDTADEG